ncbi:hypothetical protein ACFE04_004069 [Oxalis oulophora]
MVLVCFLLDLRYLSPPLLSNLKQCLLQLSNFYAITSSSSSSAISLKDTIGLCYVFRDRISFIDELKVAYSPQQTFSLRDFHFAVNNLPTDDFLPEINDSGEALFNSDMKLSSVLSDQVLYSWGGDKVVEKKVVVLSSRFPENVELLTKEILMDAADKCVSVEFVLFEQKSNHLINMQESIHSFQRCISGLDNCSFRTYLPDVRVLNNLVKRWLQDLKHDVEEPLQACFVFKENLVGMVNQIFCNLHASSNQIIDGFCPCKTCRCHGVPLGAEEEKKIILPCCAVTGNVLGAVDMIENCVKVGEKTTLFVPSIDSCMALQDVSSPIDFVVVERTNLGTLSEGVIMGIPRIVSPSNSYEVEVASDEPEFNAQLFQGLCLALRSMDEGLVCTSNCNIETRKMSSFLCFYILQPSDNNGLMLLRRLACSEEVLPVLEVNQLTHSSVPEIESAVHATLLKMESKDYNPVLHERGFHGKLNLLVNESLQLGSLHQGEHTEPNFVEPNSTSQSDYKDKEWKTPQPIAEEWEQLVVSEIPKKYSPICESNKRKMDGSVLSSPESNKQQLDAKTSRILERLEVPKQLKTKLASPQVIMKKPLLPINSMTNRPFSSSQLMKPNFQRLKKRHL